MVFDIVSTTTDQKKTLEMGSSAFLALNNEAARINNLPNGDSDKIKSAKKLAEHLLKFYGQNEASVYLIEKYLYFVY